MENVLTNGIKKYVKYLPWVCLIGLFCFLSVYMWVCGDRLTDSDISSEMLLARLLNEEHGLISKNWFYSTELRVLNIQIFYSFFFHIFRDWTMVRVATCIVSYLLMLVGYYSLLHQMGYDRIYAVSAIFLLLPVSDGYFEYVLLALLYASFISISFFAIGMIFHYQKASAGMKKILLVLTAILAFMAGMGGARHVVVLYLPMLGAAVLYTLIQWMNTEKTGKGYLVCTLAGFVSSCAGYLVNSKVLAPACHFDTWAGVSFRVSAEGFYNLLFGTLRAFGYSYGDNPRTPVASAFSCVLAFVMAACVLRTLWKKLKKPDTMWLLTLYFVGVYVLFLSMYTFTNMLYSDRYNMAAMVFAIPIMVWNLYEVEWNKYLKSCVVVFLAGGILISSVNRYSHYGRMDKTEQLRPIVEHLTKEQGIFEGYATFWNGNVLTELSDGLIEVWAWEDDMSDQYDAEEIMPWLQAVAHQTVKPEGRMFLLFSNEEYAVCPLKEALDKKEADYRSDDYLMFIFDCREEMLQAVE